MYDAEIVEIAITDIKGNVLFNSLIKPTMSIPTEATEIHGITDEMVKDAPCYADVHEQIREMLKDKIILAYNASFDSRMLSETAELYNLNMRDMKYKCVMYNQMEILNREKFIALRNCVSDIVQEHRALGDCLMVVNLINRKQELAKRYNENLAIIKKWKRLTEKE